RCATGPRREAVVSLLGYGWRACVTADPEGCHCQGTSRADAGMLGSKHLILLCTRKCLSGCPEWSRLHRTGQCVPWIIFACMLTVGHLRGFKGHFCGMAGVHGPVKLSL